MFFTDAVGIPCHDDILRLRALGGAAGWWSKVVIGDFEQISMHDGEMLYTVRNRPTPMRVGEINSLIHFAQLPDELNAKKMKEQVKNGVAVTCLQAEREKYKSEVHEICVDQASNEILSDAWPEPPDEHRREQFEDYFDFQGHRYPRKLQLQVNGSKVITANVESLQTAPFDKALLIPPQGAIERRECPDLKHAQPVKTPDPAYPQSASHNGLMGDTAVAMTVLTDGSVSDIHLIETSTHSMDEATLQNLKGWKFKPAMCGSEPVVSDIEVVVSFRLTQ